MGNGRLILVVANFVWNKSVSYQHFVNEVKEMLHFYVKQNAKILPDIRENAWKYFNFK